MDHFQETGYDETPYYNQGEADNLDSDLEHWAMELTRFNNEQADTLSADWLDSNDAMPTNPSYNYNNQEVALLGNGQQTVSPEAIAHTSKTLSALPHAQTHHTTLGRQAYLHLQNIDPIIGGSLNSHHDNSEQSLSRHPSRPVSHGRSQQIRSSAEEVRILKDEVANLQYLLAQSQEALRLEQEERCQLEVAVSTKNKAGRRPNPESSLKESEPKNSRSANIEKFKADDYYEPIKHVPAEWAGPATGQLFTYTVDGELDPEAKFSPEELEDFLLNHPPDHPLVGSRPILWIGNVPADASKRYPTKESAACRFQDCPIANNTIRKGTYRVTIDEWGYNPEWVNKDPYHNAGYVHLYCLEKFMDLPGLYRRGVAVFADDRTFKEGRNKMAITRDYPTMKDIVDHYLVYAPSLPNRAPGMNGWYKHSLSLQLTEEHLRKQPATRQSVRGTRGGNSIDVHKNNLDELVANQPARCPSPRDPNAPKRKYARRTKAAGAKRKVADASELDFDEDGEFVVDPDVLESSPSTPPRQTRAAKRRKSVAQQSWELNGANTALDRTFEGRATRDWMDKRY